MRIRGDHGGRESHIDNYLWGWWMRFVILERYMCGTKSVELTRIGMDREVFHNAAACKESMDT